ncbi:MAG: efflux RND transporter periplasmic adaptor subunit, partial [Telluria sp.]
MKLETLPPAAPTIKTTTRKRWRAPAIALTVVAIGAGGWYAMKPAPAAPAAAQAAGGKGEPKIEVYELSQRDVAAIATGELRVNLPVSGSLVPLSQATIKSKVSGVVT